LITPLGAMRLNYSKSNNFQTVALHAAKVLCTWIRTFKPKCSLKQPEMAYHS